MLLSEQPDAQQGDRTIRHYETLGELPQDDRVQLVSLWSPRRRDQAEESIRCLEAGKHVYAEKPCAMTEEDLDAIRGAVERTGMQFHEMAGTAFEQPCLPMRKLVQSGILGTVVQVFAQKSYPYHDDRPQDEEADDGLLMHAGVHAPDSVHVATTLSSCPSSDTMFPEGQAVQAETDNTAPTAWLLGEDSCPSRPP